MAFSTNIVPMPRWSTPVGCTKLILCILILAFVAACTAIYGGYPAFDIALFTASFSIVTFAYYLTALSFKSNLYNKWLVLSLETSLTVFWFISLVLLAGWTGASTVLPIEYYNVDPFSYPYDADSDLSVRSLDRTDLLGHSWQPFRLSKRQGLQLPGTMVRIHGMNARYTAQILAGISAGLAGMIFVLYGVTLATFAMNIHMEVDEATSTTGNTRTTADEEAQLFVEPTVAAPPPPPLPPRSEMRNWQSPQVDPTAAPPSVSEPLKIETLPRDFESKPQKQEYYKSPEEDTEVGIVPPTPVQKAQNAEKARGPQIEEGVAASSADSVQAVGEKERRVVRDDGRVEREI